MAILHLLNIADVFFMAAGVGVALLMIVMGGDERRQADRTPTAQAPRPRVRRR